MHLSESQIAGFKAEIWRFYQEQGRTFAWRNTSNPYHIVVSEIMLQQTQTYRVAPKYELFIMMFPTWQALAQASTHDVLSAWQGLGYNRRALSLHAIAKRVVSDFEGVLVNDPLVLVQFPGIGKATAASICAFAYNRPTIFIETNIRAVFIYFFFKDQAIIGDNQILPLVTQTVDQDKPRQWYYALMDYGVMLKKSSVNPSRKSSHYTKQSRFEGSDRQIRGAIIRLLTQQKWLTKEELINLLSFDNIRIAAQLDALYKEGFIDHCAADIIMLRRS